jgi:hypothetical protein
MELLKEIAFDEGQKAGTASRQGDWSRVKYHQNWLRDWLTLYTTEEQKELQRAFDDGYKDGYGLPIGERYVR